MLRFRILSSGTFNSLFEMRAVSVEHVKQVAGEAFNSLFEMHILHAQVPHPLRHKLSILYLRCKALQTHMAGSPEEVFQFSI